MQRIAWLDVAKGIGIALVVSAHVLRETTFGWMIFLFHMPLFFMLSGMVQYRQDLTPLLVKKARSLLIPYATYVTLLSAPFLILGAIGHPLAFWDVRLFDVLWGGQRLNGPLGVVWFVTALFLAQLIYAVILRLFATGRSPYTIAVVGMLVALGYAIGPTHADTPLNVAAVPMAVGFVWAGHILRELRAGWLTMLVGGAIGLAALATGIALSWPLDFDMKPLLFGTPGISFLIATGLSLLVMAFAMAISLTPAQKFLSYLGQASLTIMFLHQLVHLTMRRAIDQPIVVVGCSILVPLAAHFVISKIGGPVATVFGAAQPVYRRSEKLSFEH
jgi:fucose 4-O-acetylase-like acetyltransferase